MDYREKIRRRSDLRDEQVEQAQRECDTTPWAAPDALRAEWVRAQRLDPLLSRCLIQKHKDFQVHPDGHRVASDGLLERQVGTVGGPKSVPYVPVGHAAATISWRKGC